VSRDYGPLSLLFEKYAQILFAKTELRMLIIALARNTMGNTLITVLTKIPFWKK
jgi:hypothetical protein